MGRVKSSILRFDKFLRSLNDLHFILIITGLSIFVKIPGGAIGDAITYLLGINYGVFSSDVQLPEPGVEFAVYAWLIAPVIETFLGQFMPIAILNRFTKNTGYKVFVSAFIFSLGHLPVIGFLPTSFLIGLILAWAFIIKAKESKKKAFLITVIIHSLVNMVPLLALFAIDEYIHPL